MESVVKAQGLLGACVGGNASHRAGREWGQKNLNGRGALLLDVTTAAVKVMETLCNAGCFLEAAGSMAFV